MTGASPRPAAAAARAGGAVVRRRWPTLLALLAAVVLPLAGFGALAEDVAESGGLPWDAPILRFLHAHAPAGLDAWTVPLTRLGYQWGTLPVAAALVVGLAMRHRPRDSVFVLLSMAGTGAMVLALKLVFQRPRPALWPSPAPETDFAFPSGHAALNAALAACVVLLVWRTRARWPVLVLAIAWVVAVDLTRLYLGVHFPSDVLAGNAGGLAWTAGIRLLAGAPRPREPHHPSTFPTP